MFEGFLLEFARMLLGAIILALLEIYIFGEEPFPYQYYPTPNATIPIRRWVGGGLDGQFL